MSRRLGQHFLRDPAILDRIVDTLDPQPDDVVVEIGPGEGTLTRRLAPRVAQVTAIEKDVVLAERLRAGNLSGEVDSVAIEVGDALELDWHQLAARALTGASRSTANGQRSTIQRFKVVGNIPYYITSPLIEKALAPPRPTVVVYLVQREVADRIVAAPGGKAYGALSVGVRSVAQADRVFIVKAGAFTPPPKVDSAVLRMTPLAQPLLTEAERPGFRRFVVALFGQRRRQLVRGLRTGGLTKSEAEAVLVEAGLATEKRPEVLHPEEFVSLFRAMPC